MRKKHRKKAIFYRLQKTKRVTGDFFESLPKCPVEVDNESRDYIQREENWCMAAVAIIITFLSLLVYGACLYGIGRFLWDVFF